MRQADVGELKRLLGTLPQELYDEIFVFTFTATDQVRIISKGWTPPHLLHVSRTTRAKFAASYFSQAARFQFRLGSNVQAAAKVMVKWVGTFEYDYIVRIRDLKYVPPVTHPNSWFDTFEQRRDEAHLSVHINAWAQKLGLAGMGLQAVQEMGNRVKALHGGEAEDGRPFGCWA